MLSALSVTFGDSSPKGGATGVPVRPHSLRGVLFYQKQKCSAVQIHDILTGIIVQKPLFLTTAHCILRHICFQQSAQSFPACQSFSPWERWHCEAMTERARPFPTNEKAPVSQRTKSPERREPVISVTGHPWYHSLCCAKSTASLHDRLFRANRCPYNGGLPSGPTVCFSPAAQGPVTETLCTALHHPAALCTQKKIVFSPSTHLRFVQSGFILAKPAAPVKQFCSQ